MLAQPRKSYVLYGVEPQDVADGAALLKALRGAEHVVAFSAYAGPVLRDVADVILPIALLPENDGTLVNVDGLSQSVAAGAKAPGEARPGWKVLRALGGVLKLAGFEFDDLAGLREGIIERGHQVRAELAARPVVAGLSRLATWPIYRTDAVLRRSSALSAHPLNRAPAVRVNADEAQRLGLGEGVVVRVADTVLPLVIDVSVPDGTAWIEAAHDDTVALPPYGAALTLSKA
jgi:NADH-quinone oxidoreductase subunit G